MVEVNKELCDNVASVTRLSFKPGNTRLGQKAHCNERKLFINVLMADGYNVKSKHNYITATKNGEENTFYFASHGPTVTNYLIPLILAYRTNYFAFYDATNKRIYKVAYNKVREYCNTLTKAVYFGDSDPKLLVPDSWAHAQQLNMIQL